MAEAVAVFVMIGSVVLLAGRALCRKMSGYENSCACGMKACPSSDCCIQTMEKFNEE